ncbi:hypothetical protein [Microbacterium aurantiacum]|uniref:hypothetical protein n=1 Tax=Microbacterium aurantiacum TaxID=162393 RepID=UPI001F15EC67|nr:hypothetical protein [Microbacterium aurantiacum]
MAEVLIFHHIQGLTDGVRAFADDLRGAGHTVHTPDLFDGRTFATIDDGIAFAKEVGFDALRERGVTLADEYGHQPRLRRVLVRRDDRAAAGADTARMGAERSSCTPASPSQLVGERS